MTPPLTIIIPGTFDRKLATNTMKGRGWQASSKEKKDLEDRTGFACSQMGDWDRPIVELAFDWMLPLVVDWAIYYERYNADMTLRRKFDDDNVAPALKVSRDVIANWLGTSDRNFRTGEVSQHLWSSHKGESRIEVSIYPADYWIRVPREHYEMAVSRQTHRNRGASCPPVSVCLDWVESSRHDTAGDTGPVVPGDCSG